MTAETYSRHGIRFDYPEEWEVQEQEQDNELLITVSSPATSFWTLGLFFDSPSPEHVLRTVINALEDDYPELDAYQSQEMICGCESVARDLEFVCLEMLNGAWVRAVRMQGYTLLVMYQCTDYERQEYLPQLEGITRSLTCDEQPSGDPASLEFLPPDSDDSDLVDDDDEE
ncbi:MAG: hypothetical protein U0903_04930 [Planctomycetales bacterium]